MGQRTRCASEWIASRAVQRHLASGDALFPLCLRTVPPDRSPVALDGATGATELGLSGSGDGGGYESPIPTVNCSWFAHSSRNGPRTSGLDELKQVRVDDPRLSHRHAVWEPRVRLERPVLHEPCGERSRVGVGDDLIVVSVHHQHGHGDFL